MYDTALTINPLFGALTRPAMAAGVTYEYHLLNIMGSMCAFIGIDMVWGLVFIPLHVFGWLICRYDLHFFTLCSKKFLNLPQLPNVRIWGVRAYEPF